MTNNEILKADMLDILFEHRNKLYGAYTLRRDYNGRLLKSMGIALSAVLLFYLISIAKGKEQQGRFWQNDTPGMVLTHVEIDPPVKPESPKPPVHQRKVAQTEYETFRIVDDNEADKVIATQDDLLNTAISNIDADGEIPEDPGKAVQTPAETGDSQAELPKKAENRFDPIEIQPSFPGGPAALALFFSDHISTPGDLEPGEKKVVLVRFVVGEDGKVTKTEILESSGESYEREVLQAFKRMPKWNPAIQNGHKISVSFTQPITFVGPEE